MNSAQKLLYQEIEKARNSRLLVYATGDRQGMETQIGNDATDYFAEHLDAIGIVHKITLFLYTCGGNTLAGWNIVNLIRQFCDDFEVIVPVKARSTGTLMCLGANRIIMTKQATLGPIDPSMNTPLNPVAASNGQEIRVPVSVEAIKGFLELARHELNANEAALASIFEVLAQNVHPLVLGEAYRATGQIKMLAKKLLVNQVSDEDKIEKIVSFLCSESGSHDYTISRREARDNLGLIIEKPDEALYGLIKKAYDGIRDELNLRTPYSPALLLGAQGSRPYCERRVLLESVAGGVDAFVSEGVLTRIPLPQNPSAIAINDQRTFEGWKHYDE
jgi:hypothetical protein